MQDNVRVGRESLTKKISFHDKQKKPYRTIDSLEKAPTRKKINMQEYPLKKESHSFLPSNPPQHPERKVKSLTKNDLRRPSQPKKRSVMGSDPDLATLESVINRNSKYSLSRQRQRQNRQKYKRSEQVRSVIEQKKMNSISKMERKQTEPNPRLSHIYSSISVEKKPHPEKHPFVDLALESLINTEEGEEHQVTLQDVFESGCLLFYQYLQCKQQKMTHTDHLNTFDLKTVKEELSTYLDKALKKFTFILNEAGEMSIKNVVMVALLKYEQHKNNQTIMYLTKALEKTNHNLLLVELPGPGLTPNKTLTELTTGSPKHKHRHYHLNLAAYLALADSYKTTKNYLCAINTLLKWEELFQRTVKQSSSPVALKTQYQTLGSEDVELRSRMKKKSYAFPSQMQEEATRNKLKKYSHAYNYPNMYVSRSNKNLQGSDRPKSQLVELDDNEANFKTLQHGEDQTSFLQHNDHEAKEYQKQSNEIYLLLARLYLSIKNYEMSIRYYKKCLEVNPKRVQAILELASLLYHQQERSKCLHWLETALTLFQKLELNQQIELDISYIKYHKALVLLQEGQLQLSYQLLQSIQVKELWSEVNYYKGYILVQQLQSVPPGPDKNNQIQQILMLFKQSISSFTSRQYLIKSYFQILLIMVFEKKDYYGAQYEVNRFRKLIPNKQDSLKDQEEGRVSRISKLFSEEESEEDKKVKSLGLNEGYFSLLVDIIEAVISILKMKISRGLTTLKELSLKLDNQAEEVSKYYGSYQSQILKLILQFKFYCYYIQRQYELSLKHINKLMNLQQEEVKTCGPEAKAILKTDLTLLGLNRMMLECMILMRQGKFNYAMSKLTEIDDQINNPEKPINGALILNNYYMVKSLCYINLYAQLQNQKSPSQTQENHEQSNENNKEILLSAEELLRHCLISDKENSLIYYLISAIHYELEEYESSLKYIREALEYSDDHMIKHYFCKANTKAMLGRYDQAIKDYTNAVIVYKEQQKTETPTKKDQKANKITTIQQDSEEYYSQKQIMFNEIYLNRAITYLKEAYSLSRNKNFGENVNAILSYRMKATEDLVTYFQALQFTNIDLNSSKTLRNRLLLFLHSDDPSHIFEICKKLQPRIKIIQPEDCIKSYYLIKQLNNCIATLKNHLKQLETKYHEQEELKHRKDSLPPKYKKISVALPKKQENVSAEKIIKVHFDLTCLEALKKSSNKNQDALEQALISLLELTEQIYRSREEQAEKDKQMQDSHHTLEKMFLDNCGEIFRWSDILFFIGVIHFQLKQYDTAIKYFEESYNQKRINNSLYSLQKYLYPILTKSHTEDTEEPSEDELFSDLQSLFQNRIYCKEELEYNLGVCYLMQKKYKQAYFYLQNYPFFVAIIKKQIVIDNFILQENQFMSEEHPIKQEKMKKKKKIGEILIDQSGQSDAASVDRANLHQESREKLEKRAIKRMQKEQNSQNSENEENSVEEGEMIQNITPFPTRNRLCSIFSPKKIDDKQFYLSFCLPKVELPFLGLFYPEQVDIAHLYSSQSENEDSFQSSTSVFRQDSEINRNRYKIDKKQFESVIGHINLLDLQMKPIAPWIKQNNNGVIFTQNMVNESVDLNSGRTERKEKKDGKKGKNQRYGQNNQAYQ